MGVEMKRIGVEVPTETWRAFRQKCFLRMETMTEALALAIEEYLEEETDDETKDNTGE